MNNELPQDVRMALAILERRAQEFSTLAARYDDAMKRLHDMQAELEYLRREVNR